MINKEELAKAMKLRPEQHIMLAQTVRLSSKISFKAKSRQADLRKFF